MEERKKEKMDESFGSSQQGFETDATKGFETDATNAFLSLMSSLDTGQIGLAIDLLEGGELKFRIIIKRDPLLEFDPEICFHF